MNDLLSQLKSVSEQSASYDNQKLKNILALKKPLSTQNKLSQAELFSVYASLYDAYKIFNYDSAYHYARLLQQTALEMNDQNRLFYAKIKMSYCLLSAGLFKECLDSLKSINIHNSIDSLKSMYYSILGRYYYDLGDFVNDNYHMPTYTLTGSRYMDSALVYFVPNSFDYNYFRGLRELKSRNKEQALHIFRNIISNPNLTYHQLAVTASTLSDIYIQTNQPDSAILLLLQASIADIKSSTKETSAAFNLASLLFKKGDVKNASLCIDKAINDAVFYGARQRKVQVSAVLPLIEERKINLVENQKKTLITYLVITLLSLLLVITLAVIIYSQMNKLKLAKQKITDAHLKEMKINHELAETNSKLNEANKIKEEYIGYFFGANSAFFAHIEKFKKTLERKIVYRKMDEIIAVVNDINLKKEKDELLKNFDKVFLKLFPNFVEEFNNLLENDYRITLKENELLNTDLRIFALIRMGIHDTEKIAEILEYSVNTINTYKTKIKNRSLVPNELFETRIMEIKTN